DLCNAKAADFTLGMTHRQMLEKLVALGIFVPVEVDIEVEKAKAALDAGQPRSSYRELVDGRTLFVLRRPLAGGGWVATFEDVTERRRVEERMTHLAHHDTLTNLPNRSMFREKLDQALGEAKAKPLAILSLDLDRFKAVNDTFGHPAGDWLLKCVAKRLQHAVRGSKDVVARFGGDEFAIIQSGIK
ncbi:diguanylate cyclase, partial [Mesorhizobium sp. M2A.F.Ca.ET.046.02.1.1]